MHITYHLHAFLSQVHDGLHVQSDNGQSSAIARCTSANGRLPHPHLSPHPHVPVMPHEQSAHFWHPKVISSEAMAEEKKRGEEREKKEWRNGGMEEWRNKKGMEEN